MSLRACIALLLAAFLLAHAQAPLADGLPLSLDARGTALFKGAKLEGDEFTVQNVKGVSLRYLGISGENGKGIPVGIYLFDAQGKAITRLSVAEDAGMCDTMSLSPDGKMLLAGIGIDCRRVIRLWSYPDLRPVGQAITAFDPEPFHVFWTGKHDLLLNIPDGQDRQCCLEDCARSTVVLLSTATGHTEPLFRATDRCDYTVTGVQDGTVSVVEECVARLADWQNPEAKHRTRTLTKKLPATK